MALSTRLMLQGALKRVNALAGTNGKLYRDNSGWFVKWKDTSNLSEGSASAGELLGYLHGIEDALKFANNKDG